MFNPYPVKSVKVSELREQIGFVNYILRDYARFTDGTLTLAMLLEKSADARNSISVLGKAMQQLQAMTCSRAKSADLEAADEAISDALTVICEVKEMASHAEWVASKAA